MRGIYKITNKINNKVYIGESMDIKQRWISHIKELRDGNHHSYKLQSDWNEYGEDNFEFNIITVLDNEIDIFTDKHLLLILEHKYMKEYNSIEAGYNIENTLKDILLGSKIEMSIEVRIDNIKKYLIMFKNNLIIDKGGLVYYNTYTLKDVRDELKIIGRGYKALLVELGILNHDKDYTINPIYFKWEDGVVGDKYSTLKMKKEIYEFIINDISNKEEYRKLMDEEKFITNKPKILNDEELDCVESKLSSSYPTLKEFYDNNLSVLISYANLYKLLRKENIIKYKEWNGTRINIPVKEYDDWFELVYNEKEEKKYYQLHITNIGEENLVKLI